MAELKTQENDAKLDDVDLSVLRELVEKSVQEKAMGEESGT